METRHGKEIKLNNNLSDQCRSSSFIFSSNLVEETRDESEKENQTKPNQTGQTLFEML